MVIIPKALEDLVEKAAESVRRGDFGPWDVVKLLRAGMLKNAPGCKKLRKQAKAWIGSNEIPDKACDDIFYELAVEGNVWLSISELNEEFRIPNQISGKHIPETKKWKHPKKSKPMYLITPPLYARMAEESNSGKGKRKKKGTAKKGERITHIVNEAGKGFGELILERGLAFRKGKGYFTANLDAVSKALESYRRQGLGENSSRKKEVRMNSQRRFLVYQIAELLVANRDNGRGAAKEEMKRAVSGAGLPLELGKKMNETCIQALFLFNDQKNRSYSYERTCKFFENLGNEDAKRHAIWVIDELRRKYEIGLTVGIMQAVSQLVKCDMSCYQHEMGMQYQWKRP